MSRSAKWGWGLALGMGVLNLVLLGFLLGQHLAGPQGWGGRRPPLELGMMLHRSEQLHQARRQGREQMHQLRLQVLELAESPSWGEGQRQRMGELLAESRVLMDRRHAGLHEAMLDMADSLAASGRQDLLPPLFALAMREGGPHRGKRGRHGGHGRRDRHHGRHRDEHH